jgi:L-lysine 2,3-aminomutase
VLEFDHRDLATKRLAIAQMIERRYSWQTIIVEIGKCDVRCANCHRRKTSRQFGHRRSLLQNRAAEDEGGGR